MQTSNPTAAGTALAPTVAVHFTQREGEPSIERLVSGLQAVCHTLDYWQVNTRDWDSINRMTEMATAASVLAETLQSRLADPPPKPRRKAKLRAVPDGSAA
ncbi:MAG: hypothetical protein ACT4UQ_06900 [Gammaproteobacteria bacterium]